MYGYCREKFYVNHFWELKGSKEKNYLDFTRNQRSLGLVNILLFDGTMYQPDITEAVTRMREMI